MPLGTTEQGEYEHRAVLLWLTGSVARARHWLIGRRIVESEQGGSASDRGILMDATADWRTAAVAGCPLWRRPSEGL